MITKQMRKRYPIHAYQEYDGQTYRGCSFEYSARETCGLDWEDHTPDLWADTQFNLINHHFPSAVNFSKRDKEIVWMWTEDKEALYIYYGWHPNETT